MSRETPVRPGWTLALASLGVFITSLDIVVVAMALPVMRTHLHASLADLDWTINAYTLAFACLLLTGAALGDRFGRKRMYIVGTLLFTLGSLLAALSTNAGELIACRTLQGVGAALLGPLTLTLIITAVPRAKLSGAIGIWAGTSGLGVALGPVIGGAIVQGFAWQAIFWLNVPVGIILAILSAMLLRESHGGKPKFDIPGVLLAAVSLFGLTWAPVRAPTVGWSSGEVIGALVGGFIFLVAFIMWERRTSYAMLPTAFFKLRGFSAGLTVTFFQQFSLIGSLFMIAQLMQTGLNHGPLAAGVRILPMACTPMVVSPLAGSLAGKRGNRPFMVAGMALQAVGFIWLTLAVHSGVNYDFLIAPMVIAGVGLSLGFPTIASTVTASVPPQSSGIASGSLRTIGQVGAAFGVAIISAVFAAHGSYLSSTSFISGFRAAMWVAALVPVAGLIAALFAPAKKPTVSPVPQRTEAKPPSAEVA